jgi:hypothetical protein
MVLGLITILFVVAGAVFILYGSEEGTKMYDGYPIIVAIFGGGRTC